jgi:hypothetical protein
VTISNNAVYKQDGIAPKGGPNPGDIWMVDPKVANLSGLDFRLTSSSPLIDKGVDLSSVFRDDYLGSIRPYGSGYDIGSYEFGSQKDPTSTTTPTASPTLIATASPTSTPTISPTATPAPDKETGGGGCSLLDKALRKKGACGKSGKTALLIYKVAYVLLGGRTWGNSLLYLFT